LTKEHSQKVQDLSKEHKAALSNKDTQIKALAEQCMRYVVIKAERR
jgi:hypothetical protein